MVNYPNYLAGSQDDINKRLLQMILDLKKSEGEDVGALVSKVTALETAVGSKDTDAGSLKKRCADIETDIGVSTSGSETGIHKEIVDINTAIGDESTATSILGRIKALEDAE